MPDLRNQLLDELPHLKRYAMALSRSHTLSEDMVQDCVVSAIARGHQFRDDMPLRPWLFAILRNNFFTHIRREKQHPLANGETAERDLPTTNGDQETQVELSELQSALDHLSCNHRDLIVKILVEGLSYDEVAQALKVPVGTIRSRLARARINMRLELGRKTYLLEGKPPSGGRNTRRTDVQASS